MNSLIKIVIDNNEKCKSETACVGIGINGLDCSGKTYLASKFYDYVSGFTTLLM